jgi:hypothetical protein
MVACGSYVSGTEGGLQGWSTSHFQIKNGPSMIVHPDAVVDRFAKTHTVGLPYHIPGVVSRQVLEEYEDRCLNELHFRCLLARMHDVPFKTLLMELVLAGCGGTLSDRALERIGNLAELHKFTITLDEIMTAGRTGTMLLVQQKPATFRKAVSHVTMGKWVGAGVVLASKKEAELALDGLDEDPNYYNRTLSNRVDCTRFVSSWKSTRNALKNAAGRRNLVLKKLKLDESQTWGAGVLLFTPIDRGGLCRGMKNRFLPLLTDTVVDATDCSKIRSEWLKPKMNKAIVSGVNAWVDYKPEKDLNADYENHDIYNAMCLFVERILACKYEHGQVFRPGQLVAKLPGYKYGVVCKVLRKCCSHGMLSKKRKLHKRKQCYFLESLFVPPWKHHKPINW